jgi:hypothetical protein
MTAFIAHDIASWVGVPTALVVVGLVMLRRWGKGLRARRQQAGDHPTAVGSSIERFTSQSH